MKARAAVLTRDGYQCVYCSLRGTGTRAETVDHILPRSWGGTNAHANLVAACEPCNTAKGDRLDWFGLHDLAKSTHACAPTAVRVLTDFHRRFDFKAEMRG